MNKKISYLYRPLGTDCKLRILVLPIDLWLALFEGGIDSVTYSRDLELG